jgi:hypothetical protein
MPLFDWQASSKGGIVGQYFWIYWAFTIPLTALVLGAWTVWIQLKLKKHRKEDNEVRARRFFSLVSEKNFAKVSDA